MGSWRHPTRMCASLISSSPSAHPHPTSLTIHVLQTEAEASKAQGLHQVLRTKKGMPGQPQGHTGPVSAAVSTPGLPATCRWGPGTWPGRPLAAAPPTHCGVWFVRVSEKPLACQAQKEGAVCLVGQGRSPPQVSTRPLSGSKHWAFQGRACLDAHQGKGSPPSTREKVGPAGTRTGAWLERGRWVQGGLSSVPWLPTP